MLLTVQFDQWSPLLLATVIVAANVLGGAMALPQVVKLRRARRADGVSAAWAGCSGAVNAWWIAYGLGSGDVGIVPMSIVSVAAYTAIGIALVRFRAPGTAGRTACTLAGSGLAIAALPVVALLVGGWPAAGLALGALYGIQLAPAVVAVYRSVDVSGVSVGTWSMALAEALLWGGYGFARADLGLLALGATGSLMSSLVLVRVLLRRPRRRVGATPVWGGTLAAA